MARTGMPHTEMNEPTKKPAGKPGPAALALIVVGGLALPVYIWQSDPGFRPEQRGPQFWIEAAIAWGLGIAIAAGLRLWAKKRL